MKKFFSLIAAVLFAGSMMADVVISGSAFAGQGTSSTGSPVSATVEGVTFECDKAYSDDAHSTLRCYKNGVITITAPEKITKLIFQFYQTYNGGLANEVVVDANEWTYTLASQARIEQVTVSFGDSPAPVVDTLNVAQAIEIASALADNASSKEYFIEGFAVNVADYYVESGTPKNQTFYIVEDAAAPDSVLQAFRATPQKEGKAYPVLAGDKVRLFGKLQKYVKNDKTQLEVVTPTVEFLSEVEGDRTIDIPVVTLDTIDVAKALEIGGALEAGKSSDVAYVIEGFVSNIVNYYDATNENETFWMADTKESTAKSNAEGAFEVYRGKIDQKEEIGLHAHVFVTAKIYKYQPMKNNQPNGDPVIETANSPVPTVNVVEKGEQEEVIVATVAEAMEIGGKLADGATTEKRYEITGYVSNVYNFLNPDFGSETLYISDDPESTSTENAFQIYRGKPSTKTATGLHAKVKVITKIKNFKGTIETDGSTIPFEVLEASTFVPDTVNIDEVVNLTEPLAEGSKTPVYYVVKGFIQEPGTFDTKNSNATFKLSQFPNEAEGPVTAYRATVLKADAEKVATKNNYVNVTGYLMKKGGAQIAQGAITAFVEAPDMDTIHVNVAEALAAGLDLEIGAKSERIYAVTGFVNIVDEPFADGVETFYMADDALSEAQNFLALEIAIEVEASVGRQVEVVGRLQNTDGETVMIENGKARIIPGEGIESIVLTEKAQKVVVDGVIYIVRDNKLFNLQGAQVR
jgi:hypothetical protein